METDNRFVGFLYIPNDENSLIDSSIAINSDNISNNPSGGSNTTFFDILAKFKDPVKLTYRPTVVNTSGNSMVYIVENTDGSRDEIDVVGQNSKWPSIFEIARYIYDYFYANVESLTPTQLTSNIESRLIGDIDSNIGPISMSTYVANSFSMVTVPGSNNKLAKISFSIVHDSVQNRNFEIYVNPDYFIQEYTPDDPYIYIWYTPNTNVSMSGMSSAITQVQDVIAKKILTQHYVYNARTVVEGVTSYTPIHIWSNRNIPTSGLRNPFLNAVQAQIRAIEPLLTEEQLIEKYPEIFTNEIRVLYCVSDNTTINNSQLNGSSLYSSPIDYFKIKECISGLNIFGGESSEEHFEVFNVEANQIWMNIISTGITDKLPCYRPTNAGIEALENKGADPEDTGAAKRFLRTLVRIINNAYDGIDFNSSTDYTIDSSDPTITPPNPQLERQYYSFIFKTVEWHVFAS